MNVVALAGGTGSAKLLRGLESIGCNLKVVANVGDNIWIHGLYVCPDVDIAMYTLAGIANSRQGWGIEGDTFGALGGLESLGEEAWFRLGDRDLATCLLRTRLIREGRTLTEVTAKLCKALGVREAVLPASDSMVETHVLTSGGEMHLQEFWVKLRGRPRIKGVRYVGANRATPTRRVREALRTADRIIVCPANPVTSVGPILAIRGMLRALKESKARKVALSPMIGRAPFSGPAGRMMRSVGRRNDSVGVAEQYSGFLDAILIDSSDRELTKSIGQAGVQCSVSEIKIRTPKDGTRLALELMDI